MDVLAELKNVRSLENVPESQLKWLIEKGECITIEKGDNLFAPGTAIDRLLAILDGEFVIKIEQSNQFRVVGKMKKHDLSGLLPYSRASVARGYAESLRKSHVLTLDKSLFPEMISDCHELTTALVHVMSTRIREFTKLEQQNDKMMALGKLSAGLAHELNNPSAAIVRSAQELSKHLKYLPENFKNVIKINVTDDQVDTVNDILFSKVSQGQQDLSMMERSEKEDELMDWLDDHEVDESDEISSNFVDYGIEYDDLETIAENVSEEDLSPVVGWLNQVLTTEKLVSEIEEASKRINDLVTSVKKYTHMDQAPEKTKTNIHDGMDNTITMLNHKLRKNKIDVIKKYCSDMVHPEILASEMNQVWTNLIDNAIDAMENTDKRQLELETRTDGKYVEINITDSGSGIPEDVRSQIFDPFFTTKPIGKGTGLGLDVVNQIIINQHQGHIKVDSVPGKTTFSISLPIKAA